MFGLGLTIAIILDATIVRMLLVPAFMRILGRANWWAPQILHLEPSWSRGARVPQRRNVRARRGPYVRDAE